MYTRISSLIPVYILTIFTEGFVNILINVGLYNISP